MIARIYTGTDRRTGEKRLVRASNQPQVYAFLARENFTVNVASQEEIVAVMEAGKKPEDALGPHEPEPE